MRASTLIGLAAIVAGALALFLLEDVWRIMAIAAASLVLIAAACVRFDADDGTKGEPDPIRMWLPWGGGGGGDGGGL